MRPAFDRLGALAAGAAFTLLFAIAGMIGGPAFRTDVELIHLLAADRASHAGLSGLAIAATQVGGAPGMLAILGVAILVLGLKRQWRNAITLSAIVLSGRVAVELLKIAIDRPRPHFGPYPVSVSSLSFPSGHAANSMMTFLALTLIAAPERHRRPAIAAAVLASVLIGSTRPFLGVHWPSDVIGGWAFGIAWVTAAVSLSRSWRAAAEQ